MFFIHCPRPGSIAAIALLIFAVSGKVPLPNNGKQVVIQVSQKAVASQTDNRAMVLLLANLSKKSTASYTYVYGNTLRHGHLSGGSPRLYRFTFNPQGNPLAVSNISHAPDTDINVALYSSNSKPDITLSTKDPARVPFVQYQSAGAELALGKHYYLELGAPSEVSKFILLEENSATSYCVNVSDDALKCDKTCAGNTARICLLQDSALYVVNSSPTPTSGGYISLMDLNASTKGLQLMATHNCEYWDQC